MSITSLKTPKNHSSKLNRQPVQSLTVICRLVCWLASARIELGSSVDLQLKKVLELGSTFGEVVSETLLLEARPQAFRVPGLEPGDVGLEVEL